ncbi:ankyrin repeat-containing domain protein [Coprinopsis sp. MPI-PUGE-AT-0042]|nr:ankyrin repeat-containing domain protein [Coprinopsis sp. MPI-PUGE-AT-0042]
MDAYATSGASLISGTHGAHISGGAFTVAGHDSFTTVHHHHHAPADIDTVFHSSSLPNFRDMQIDTLAKATKGTCLWFTDGQPFQIWIKRGKILWGIGIPGAGKTVLASVVIGYLEHLERSSGGIFCLTFIFFRYSEPLSVRDILESLIKQILERHPDIGRLVEQCYAKYRRERTKPSPQVLVGLLSDFVKNGKTLFLVLDALDELLARVRLVLLELLTSVDAKLFITSRPLETLQRDFPQAKFVELVAHPSDIDLHIKESLRRNPDLRLLVEGCDLEDRIIETIHDKYGGMFLHANLQLEALGRSLSIQDAEEMLSQFPLEIGKAHLKTWERILDQGPKHANIAKLIFLWILHANGDLNVTVLRRALATCPDTYVFEPRRMVPEALLVSVCCGLVSVDKRTRVIRLIHYTAKEIILPLLLESFPHPHAILAQVCISRLTACGFQDVSFDSDKDSDEALDTDPLLRYAHSSWNHHACKSLESERVTAALTGFVLGCINYPAWTWTYGSTNMDLMGPLHLAAMYGFEQLIHPAAQVQPPNFQTPCRNYSPLMLACERGQGACVLLLLALPSIDVNLGDFVGATAFILAAQEGHVAILRHLPKVPDLNCHAACTDGWDALLFAAFFGRTEAVQFLLGIPGTDPNGPLCSRELPLPIAAYLGHIDIVKLLLGVPDIDVNATEWGGRSALHCAADQGHIEIVRCLLQAPNIDVNASERCGMNALMCASKYGHTEAVRLLLAVPGIVVDAVDCAERTALALAVRDGHQEVIDLILDFWILRCTGPGWATE